MTVFALSKAGYGSINELRELTTKEFLDLVEYEHISADITAHLMKG